jgi:hypothetical protein
MLIKFTGSAAALWAAIPAAAKKQLLSNVWCGKCRHEVTIKNFTVVVKGIFSSRTSVLQRLLSIPEFYIELDCSNAVFV